VVAVGDPFKETEGFLNLFKYQAKVDNPDGTMGYKEVVVMPKQNGVITGSALEGSGPMPSVYATPAEGPHLPCPVEPPKTMWSKTAYNGVQQPCDDGASKSHFWHKDQTIPTFFSPPPDNLTVYVTNFNIDEVPIMSFSEFQVTFSYTATWSDRYAVHPCTINLYDTGAGVGASGKVVPSADWWLPTPNLKQNIGESVKHEANVKVFHNPTDPVLQACADNEECPWPKQLFLSEKITLTAKKASSFVMHQHPFDVQTIEGTIDLVSNIAYPSFVPKVKVNFTEFAQAEESVKDIYGGTDWTVLSAQVTQSETNELQLDFSIKMKRASASVVFKVLIPVMAISLVSILAGFLEANDRLLVVSVSVLAGSSMLDPDFLSLPAGTQGIPFLMALVIGHMAINSVLLVYSMYIEMGNTREKWKLKYHEDRTQAVVHEIWERSFARYRALASDVSIMADADSGVEASKEESKAGALTSLKGIFKRGKEEPEEKAEEKEAPKPNVLDESQSGQLKRLTEIMWLMPMLIGNAIHGNADDPPMPMGPIGAYDLDSADAQEERDETGQQVVAKLITPAYLFVYFVTVLVYFAGGEGNAAV